MYSPLCLSYMAYSLLSAWEAASFFMTEHLLSSALTPAPVGFCSIVSHTNCPNHYALSIQQVPTENPEGSTGVRTITIKQTFSIPGVHSRVAYHKSKLQSIRQSSTMILIYLHGCFFHLTQILEYHIHL